MKKRKSLEVQRAVLEAIRKSPGITMHQLEKVVGTNPASLREHCAQLSFLNLVKIEREEKTKKVYPCQIKIR